MLRTWFILFGCLWSEKTHEARKKLVNATLANGSKNLDRPWLDSRPAVNTWKIIEWSNILFGMLSRHARQKSAYFRTIWWATLALYRRHYHDQEYAKYQDKGKISKWYNLLFRVSQIKESTFALKKIWDILRDILYLEIEYVWNI